jgi:hypothetical protein
MQIEATPANWDADVETDGLLLTVLPIDENGAIAPVTGTLDVELIGEGPGTTSTMRTLPQLGRWVQKLTPEDCGANGYTFRLSYQAWHPEFNLQLGVFGLAHARLAVAGSPVVEASANVQSMRPFSPIRDRMQQLQLDRFLPGETTGHGRQASGLYNGL